jgi:hypothetical protein
VYVPPGQLAAVLAAQAADKDKDRQQKEKADAYQAASPNELGSGESAGSVASPRARLEPPRRDARSDESSPTTAEESPEVLAKLAGARASVSSAGAGAGKPKRESSDDADTERNDNEVEPEDQEGKRYPLRKASTFETDLKHALRRVRCAFLISLRRFESAHLRIVSLPSACAGEQPGSRDPAGHPAIIAAAPASRHGHVGQGWRRREGGRPQQVPAGHERDAQGQRARGWRRRRRAVGGFLARDSPSRRQQQEERYSRREPRQPRASRAQRRQDRSRCRRQQQRPPLG